jgi:hypothetical protein
MRNNDSVLSSGINRIGKTRKKFKHKSSATMKFKKKGMPREYSKMLDGFIDQV